MIRLRWFLLFLALVMSVATWRVWWVAENRSATDLIEAAESRLERDSTDHAMALRELGLALRVANESGDPAAAQRALVVRAEVNYGRNNYSMTLADCDRLLEEFSPDDPKALRLAALAALRGKELQRAIDYASLLSELQPDEANSQNLLAKIHAMIVEEILEELFERLDQHLPTSSAEEGLRHARKAAALSAGSPHGLSALEALDELVEDPELSVALRSLTERARAHSIAARSAWLAALKTKRNGEALVGLQTQLSRAGLHEEVISLGRSNLLDPSFPYAGEVLVYTALAQADLGRAEDARKLISNVKALRPGVIVPSSFDRATVLRWLALAHELELWQELEEATRVAMRGRYYRSTTAIRATNLSYLLGISLLEQNRTQAALPALSRSGRFSDKREFVPGEQVLSWYARATAQRRMAQRREEQRSILEVTQVRAVPLPDGGRAARAFGDALERLALSEEREGKYARAVESLALAVAYLPERREELEGRWKRLGERSLESQGRTLQEYRELFAIDERQQPGSALNSWATVEIANRQLAHGRAPQAITLIRRSLNVLPYFPPLLEVAGEAYSTNGDWSRAISAWLQLGTLYGYTPELAKNLASVPAGEFPTKDLIRWAALDPRQALLSGMVREMIALGQSELALQAIQYLGGQSSSAEEYLLGAGLSASDRNWRKAFDSLERIDVADPVFARAAALLVRSAVELGNLRSPDSPLSLAVERTLAAERLSAEGFPAALDALFAAGQTARAAALARRLTDDLGIREFDILLRRAVAEVSLRQVDAGRLALDKAEAFSKSGEVLLGRLLLATDFGKEEEVRETALKLILGPFKNSQYQRGIARVLYGDLDRGLPLLAAADRAHEGLHFPTRLAFLTGLALASDEDPESSTGDALLDRELAIWRNVLSQLSDSLGPNHILTLLLAQETDPWQGWASTRLLELSDVLGSHNWALLLSAYNNAALGRTQKAEQLAQPLTRARENLPWSWVLLEQIALKRSAGVVDFSVVRARVGRVLAIGSRGLDPAETPHLVGEVLQFLDRPVAAQRVLEVGLKRLEWDDPRRNPILKSLARTARVNGDMNRSLQSYDELLHSKMKADFEDLVPEFIDLMGRMSRDGTLTPSAYLARLEGLAARFPRDPAPIRAIATKLANSKDELSNSPVSRALARLNRFRDETEQVPLEGLRRGEAAHWTQLVATMDPPTAADLAQAELLFAPYSVELWRTWANALRDSGRHREALAVFRTLAAVVPDLESMKSLAQILIESGGDPRLALAAAGQARLRLKPDETDPELDLVEAIAEMFSSDKGFNPGVRKLQRLFARAQAGDFDLEPWRIAHPLIEALHGRGHVVDWELAIKISEQAAKGLDQSDRLRADWFRVMGITAAQNIAQEAKSSPRQ